MGFGKIHASGDLTFFSKAVCAYIIQKFQMHTRHAT